MGLVLQFYKPKISASTERPFQLLAEAEKCIKRKIPYGILLKRFPNENYLIKGGAK